MPLCDRFKEKEEVVRFVSREYSIHRNKSDIF